MSKKASIMIIALLVITPLTAYSEFYKYTDETGAIRFTDDITQIPEDQRPKVKQYYDAPESQSTGAEGAQSSQAETQPAEEEAGDNPFAAIEQKQKALDAELDELNAELQALREMRPQITTRKQRAEYEKRVNAYNERLKAYEKKRVTLEAEDARIRAELAAKQAEQKAAALKAAEKKEAAGETQ